MSAGDDIFEVSAGCLLSVRHESSFHLLVHARRSGRRLHEDSCVHAQVRHVVHRRMKGYVEDGVMNCIIALERRKLVVSSRQSKRVSFPCA